MRLIHISLSHTKGSGGSSFELIDWQEQICDIFGILKPNGFDSSNTAYGDSEEASTELAAAIALLLTCGDGEERAEVYGCAADRRKRPSCLK